MFSALDSFIAYVRAQRRLDKQLQAISREISSWQEAPQVEAIARSSLKTLQATVAAPLPKGAPDLLSAKKEIAGELLAFLDMKALTTSALAHARRIAAIDPSDPHTRRVALAFFWLCNQDIINYFRQLSSAYLALHMTCQPRLERALQSEASFGSIPAPKLCHVKLIGNSHSFRINKGDGVLEVPAPDSYEHLPSKVMDAYAILAFSDNVRATMKMDDDHRLKDADSLLQFFRLASESKGAVQFGHVYSCDYPSKHSHGWHFGKTKNPQFDGIPFNYPSPVQWCTGEYGYILNHAAMLRMLWAWLYFQRWTENVLYEDICLGEISDKLGVRKKNVQLDSSLQFHEKY